MKKKAAMKLKKGSLIIGECDFSIYVDLTVYVDVETFVCYCDSNGKIPVKTLNVEVHPVDSVSAVVRVNNVYYDPETGNKVDNPFEG